MADTRSTIQRMYNTYFRMDSPIPYQIDDTGNYIYMRWSNDSNNPVFIRRVSINGSITQNDYTLALWANRTTATYQYNFDNIS